MRTESFIKSLDLIEVRFRNLHEFYSDVEARAVLVTKYVDARQEEGAKNATINRELAAPKRLFTLGRRAN